MAGTQFDTKWHPRVKIVFNIRQHCTYIDIVSDEFDNGQIPHTHVAYTAEVTGLLL
jgi:hypothetical protein